MFNLLFVLLSTSFDRARGSQSYLTILPAFLLAGYIGLNVPDLPWWGVLAIAMGYILGESTGWRHPIGSFLKKTPMPKTDLHWWQQGKLFKTNILAALILRGCLWGLPPAIVCIVFGISPIPFLLFPISFVGSLYITRAFFEKDRPEKSLFTIAEYKIRNKDFADLLWSRMEYVRGLMITPAFIWFY